MGEATRVLATRARGASATPRLALAPLTRRVLGAAIDTVLLIVVAGLLSAMIGSHSPGTTRVVVDASGARTVIGALGEPTWLPLLVFTAVTAAYVIPLMALWGRTIGGWCVGIRCARIDTGGTPGWGVSIRRWALLYGIAGLAAFLPVIGGWAWLATLVIGLSPAWDRTGRLRGYADRFAGDIVVRTPR